MGTLSPTYDVLFEEDNYYIVSNDGYSLSFERDSVIIHVCPNREGQEFHHQTITMPGGNYSYCYYCKTDIPQSVQTLYLLQNFDHITTDRHADWIGRPLATNTYNKPNKNK